MRGTFLVMPTKTPALLPSAGLSPTGLALPTSLSAEDWEEVGYMLDNLDGALPWAWGDWLCARPKGRVDQDAVQISGKPWDSLRNYRYVAENVAPGRRLTGLSWNHHQAVAAMEDWEQDRMLERAANEHLTVMALRAEVKALTAPAPDPPSARVDALPPDVVASEVVDPIEELEREYGIERNTSGATPKNAVRAAVRDSLKALTSLRDAIDGVTTWPADLAAEFNPVWAAIADLGDRYTARQEPSV